MNKIIQDCNTFCPIYATRCLLGTWWSNLVVDGKWLNDLARELTRINSIIRSSQMRKLHRNSPKAEGLNNLTQYKTTWSSRSIRCQGLLYIGRLRRENVIALIVRWYSDWLIQANLSHREIAFPSVKCARVITLPSWVCVGAHGVIKPAFYSSHNMSDRFNPCWMPPEVSPDASPPTGIKRTGGLGASLRVW